MVTVSISTSDAPAFSAPISSFDGADGKANTLNIRLEYALVITFLYGQTYDCKIRKSVV